MCYESGSCPGGGHGNSLQDSYLKNPMTEEPDGLQSMRSQRVKTQLEKDTTSMLSRAMGGGVGKTSIISGKC